MKKLQKVTVWTVAICFATLFLNFNLNAQIQPWTGNTNGLTFSPILFENNFNNTDCNSVGVDDCYQSQNGISTISTLGAITKPYFTINKYKIDPNSSIFQTNKRTLFDKSLFIVDKNGNVGINTFNPIEKLHVIGNTIIDGNLIVKGTNNNTSGNNEILLKSDGSIRARDIQVDFDEIPDYVFGENYNLMTLSEVKEFIKINKHLPNIRSEKEFNDEGSISLSEMNLKLLEKIEELTLYVLDLQEQINELKK